MKYQKTMLKNLSYRSTAIASYVGYITQAIVNNFSPLLFLTFSEHYGIPTAKITLLITVNFTIQLLIDWFSPYLVTLLGCRVSVVLAHFSAALGMVGLAAFPAILPSPFWGLMLAVFFYAIGGGFIEVLVSPIIEACPFERKAAAMSLLHSFYCWGQLLVILVSTLFFGIFGIDNWKILSCIWALIPFCNAFLFLCVPLYTAPEGEKTASRMQLFKQPFFRLLLLIMFCAGAAELSMSQWASSFAEAGLQVSKAVGDLTGPCCFALLMGIARLLYAKIDGKVSLYIYMLGSSILCVFSYLLAALTALPALSLIGCALCGFSVGILWPGALSIAARQFPQGGTALFSTMALSGDLGCTIGPTMVGLISAAAGDQLSVGLLCALLFPLLLTIIFLLSRRLRHA